MYHVRHLHNVFCTNSKYFNNKIILICYDLFWLIYLVLYRQILHLTKVDNLVTLLS